MKTRPRALFVLDSAALNLVYGAEIRDEIAGRAVLIAPAQTRAMIARKPELLRDVEVIFSGWGAPVMDAAFLAAAPALRAVFYGAGSTRDFTTPAFWTRGITLSHAAAANAVPVAEYTLATIFFSLKHGWHRVLETRRLGRFPEPTRVPGAFHSKIGLVSLGLIGRLVRERLQPFDLEVLAFDPWLDEPAARALAVRRVSLEELFRDCDVVSLHTPLLPGTTGMIHAGLFDSMKAGATFINTARGALVREAEMIEVLSRRTDLTAVLDVTWPEPPAPGSLLYTLPNVVLTPHLAGAQQDECRRLGRLMLAEFDRWLRDEPLRHEVSAASARSRA